jgi:O-6-methylguanine DNA methyltransferase
MKDNIKKIYYWEFQSKGLTAHVASSDVGVVRVKVCFARDENFLQKLKLFYPEPEFFQDSMHNELVISAIKSYLEGDNSPIDIPWDIESTSFIFDVWKSLCKIPYGETRTYKDVASMVGVPKGARAVGQAVKRNPLLIIIPCHRVVAVNGIGGFSSGIELKKYLLNLEKKDQF